MWATRPYKYSCWFGITSWTCWSLSQSRNSNSNLFWNFNFFLCFTLDIAAMTTYRIPFPTWWHRLDIHVAFTEAKAVVWCRTWNRWCLIYVFFFHRKYLIFHLTDVSWLVSVCILKINCFVFKVIAHGWHPIRLSATKRTYVTLTTQCQPYIFISSPSHRFELMNFQRNWIQSYSTSKSK